MYKSRSKGSKPHPERRDIVEHFCCGNMLLFLINLKIQKQISGLPKTSTTDDQVDAIHCMVLNDRCLSVKQTAKFIGISSGSVHAVLTEILGMSELSARWVPKMLTPDQKLQRVNISRTLLTHCYVEPKNLLCKLITQDETWIHHFKPE